MLKTLIFGVVVAFVGSKLKKMNDDGRLDSYKERARDGAEQLRNKVADQMKSASPDWAPASTSAKTSSTSAASRGLGNI